MNKNSIEGTIDNLLKYLIPYMMQNISFDSGTPASPDEEFMQREGTASNALLEYMAGLVSDVTSRSVAFCLNEWVRNLKDLAAYKDQDSVYSPQNVTQLQTCSQAENIPQPLPEITALLPGSMEPESSQSIDKETGLLTKDEPLNDHLSGKEPQNSSGSFESEGPAPGSHDSANRKIHSCNSTMGPEAANTSTSGYKNIESDSSFKFPDRSGQTEGYITASPILHQYAIHPEVIESNNNLLIRFRLPFRVEETDLRIDMSDNHAIILIKPLGMEQIVPLPPDIVREKAAATLKGNNLEVIIPKHSGPLKEISIRM